MSSAETKETAMSPLTTYCETKTSTVLIDALLIMDAATTLSTEERMVRMAIIEELERRFDVEAAMEAWCEDTDTAASYIQALVAAIKEAAA